MLIKMKFINILYKSKSELSIIETIKFLYYTKLTSYIHK